MHLHSSADANAQLSKANHPKNALKPPPPPCTRGWDGRAYLGGDVVGRAAEGAGGVALKHALPAHAEVGDLDVALAVQQHVVQLQVSAAAEDGSRGCKSLGQLTSS